MWWSEKIYKIWSRLYLFIVTRWPWCVTTAIEVEEKAEATPVAPKRSRRQPAINARDACYNLFDALSKGLKRILICKILCVQGSLNLTYRTLHFIEIFFVLCLQQHLIVLARILGFLREYVLFRRHREFKLMLASNLFLMKCTMNASILPLHLPCLNQIKTVMRLTVLPLPALTSCLGGRQKV